MLLLAWKWMYFILCKFFITCVFFAYLEHLTWDNDQWAPGRPYKIFTQAMVYFRYDTLYIYVQNLVEIGSVVFESIKNNQTNVDRDRNIQRPQIYIYTIYIQLRRILYNSIDYHHNHGYQLQNVFLSIGYYSIPPFLLLSSYATILLKITLVMRVSNGA